MAFVFRKDLKYKVVSEQVSHHPPISAFHVSSDEFKVYGAINPKLKFWGKSVEITPQGTCITCLCNLPCCFFLNYLHCPSTSHSRLYLSLSSLPLALLSTSRSRLYLSLFSLPLPLSSTSLSPLYLSLSPLPLALLNLCLPLLLSPSLYQSLFPPPSPSPSFFPPSSPYASLHSSLYL